MGMTEDGIPFVAISANEYQNPPWGHDLTCPICGQEDLPLKSSTALRTDGSHGITLHYISHCGGTWMRGPIER